MFIKQDIDNIGKFFYNNPYKKYVSTNWWEQIKNIFKIIFAKKLSNPKYKGYKEGYFHAVEIYKWHYPKNQLDKYSQASNDIYKRALQTVDRQLNIIHGKDKFNKE